eukprot:189300-Pelagomonas_calceolata.AAC.1
MRAHGSSNAHFNPSAHIKPSASQRGHIAVVQLPHEFLLFPERASETHLPVSLFLTSRTEVTLGKGDSKICRSSSVDISGMPCGIQSINDGSELLFFSTLVALNPMTAAAHSWSSSYASANDHS